jgi:ABC-type transport system involved in multi-copper enzyme maturation permease subunit
MWAHEFRVTIRQALFVMAFFVLVPLAYLADVEFYRTGLTFLEYMSNGLDLFILVTALYLAYNMFRSEEEDGATEYLLSLPMDRTELIKYKIMPRITVMMPLVIAGYLLADHALHQSVFLYYFISWSAGFLYVFLLVAFMETCGFILGLLGRGSWSARLLLMGMVVCAWYFCTFSLVIENLIYKASNVFASSRFSCWLGKNGQALLDFGVFFLLLWYILKPLLSSWDCKPLSVRAAWFQRRAILPVAVFILLLVHRLVIFHYIPFFAY